MSAWDWGAAAIPAAVAWVLIAWLRRSALARRLVDRPNERSLHEVPTPRIGGIAILAAALPAAALVATPSTLILLGGALLLGALSALDDVHSLPIEVRLPAHIGVALICLLAIAGPAAGVARWSWLEVCIAVLVIAWMTNLFNFMDGADGLAGGMAVIGFGALAIAAWQAGAFPLARTCIVIASACAGFLAHNFPPARVFLGDAGSIPLGFLSGALGAQGMLDGVWPWWFPLLVFSPFIVDATFTVLRRAGRGERVWRAHREHAYQRLAMGGWPRRRLALASYAVMSAMAAAALLALPRGEPERWAIIFVCLAVHVALMAAIERQFPGPGPTRAGGARGGGFDR